MRKRKKDRSLWIWILILILIMTAIGFFIAGTRPGGGKQVGDTIILDDGDAVSVGAPYIGRIHIEGEISGTDADSDIGYRHAFLMDLIRQMEKDPNNRGILLDVDTPGGAVYQTDELYLQLKHYKKKTGRPIYTYMGNEAASGGYYISSLSDRIIANRNCWTGSIGVTMGSIYDITGLMEKYGVKATAIHAGRNKAMGSITEPLTDEQEQILMSLVNESYDRFVQIVADGRNLPLEDVRNLADGRVYTASQAKSLGLIDEIGTLEKTEKEMKTQLKQKNLQVIDFRHTETASSGLGDLLGILNGKSDVKKDDLETIEKIMKLSEKVDVSYEAPLQK
ncbi:MAG: signal peptide peptidase SppA [Eubacteriales bacterium]|nr:signal peptide peptidase SppA [Eubacteriales bacterium]